MSTALFADALDKFEMPLWLILTCGGVGCVLVPIALLVLVIVLLTKKSQTSKNRD